MAPLADQVRRDLLEILNDRYERRSTLITSQIPVEQWHAYLQDPTITDSILDRLIHNSYRLALEGESMRKQKGASAATSKTKARCQRLNESSNVLSPSARHALESPADERGIRSVTTASILPSAALSC